MDDFWQDLRYGARRLAAAPWFTLAAVAALSLGIGANTTVFTMVNAVLLRGLPFEDPDRIMAVWTTNEIGQEFGVSHLDYQDLRDQSRSFEGLAEFLTAPVNISNEGQLAEQVAGAYVSGNVFRMLGEQPILGRSFTDDDDRPGAQPVVLLGYGVWQSRYGADPDVLGRTIRVNSLVATVVGVMRENMRFPFNNDIWIPQINLPPETNTDDRSVRNFNVAGRLAPGVSLEQARQELRAIGGRLAEAYPATNQDFRPEVGSFLERANGDEIRILFLTLMGAVAFVLLIACANVANLLLARSTERSREIAVRVSLGASRGRIVRQLLVESLLLSLAAGIVGLVLAVMGIRWFDVVVQNMGVPYWMDFSMDAMVFAFIAGVCVATGLLFGLAPALHVSKTDVNEVLKEGTRGGSGGLRARRWAGAMIVGELALTLVLLSGAGFMMQSFLNLYRQDDGVDTSGLLAMQVYMPLTQYPEPEPRMELYDALLERLRDVGIVEASTLTSALPVFGGGTTPVEIDGGEADPEGAPPTVTLVTASEGYWDVLGLAPLRGRVFDREDGLPGSEAVVVNQRFVDLHLRGEDPLGRRVRLGAGGPEAPWRTVVGVTPTIAQGNLDVEEPNPVVYLPLRNNPARGLWLVVKSPADFAEVTPLVREAMQAVEPDVPLFNIRSMDQVLADQRSGFRVFGLMFAIFAGIALVLSAVGIYSVTANSVIQRVREFGIRVSLGAEPRQISWLALRRVLVQMAIGFPLGLIGAFGVGQVLQSLLVQTSPGDPRVLVGVVLLMAGVTILACLWPARSAARLDPVEALRVE